MNLGPFAYHLREDDVIAQRAVARIFSPPLATFEAAWSSTHGQTEVSGRSEAARKAAGTRRPRR